MRIAAFALIVSLTFSAGALAQAPNGAPERAAPNAEGTTAACPYCRASLSIDDFCPRCGRLARVVETTAAHRVWLEAPYVPVYPPLDDSPVIEATLSPDGIQKELVRFGSGDRFEATPGKGGLVVKGKMGSAGEKKELTYSGSVRDTLDGRQRLVTREVFALAPGHPDQHLYRRLEYVYEQDLLARIDFKAWLYRGASDWKSKPSSWVRHNAGTIGVLREHGVLVRLETVVREGTRSLRGDLEYREPRTLVEQVVRDEEGVDHVVRSVAKEAKP